MTKKYNPDAPLTDEEMRNGKWMYGIDELPKEAQQAIKNSMPGRPVSKNPKKAVSIRLDEDILTELRSHGKGWQTEINQVLRQYIEENRV